MDFTSNLIELLQMSGMTNEEQLSIIDMLPDNEKKRQLIQWICLNAVWIKNNTTMRTPHKDEIQTKAMEMRG